MNILVIQFDESESEVSRSVISLDDVASAAFLGGWCWPAIEGESDSLPLPVAADILVDHLKGGDKAFLCDIGGRSLVQLTPYSH